MADLLVDTDVLVDHLRTSSGVGRRGDRLAYSTITRAELFAGRHVQEEGVRLLLEPMRELAVNRAVAERAGRIRRDAAIALPDALIAATAVEHRLGLLTRNRSHFDRVPKLRLHTPR